MNPILLAAEIAAGAGLVAGQLYDVYTTYVGVYVQKDVKEGSGIGLVKWLVANKYRLLIIKPAVAVAAAIGLNLAANSVHTGQAIDPIVSHIATMGPMAVGAVMGLLAGRSNAAANKAALAAKSAVKKA